MAALMGLTWDFHPAISHAYTYMCACVYTYIHTHTVTHICEIYIYIVSQGLLEPLKTRLHCLQVGLPYLLIHLNSESLFPHLFKTGILTVLRLPEVL